MSGGMTVNPVISEGDDGQEYIADFSVQQTHSYTDHNGQPVGYEDDFIEDENGEWQYQMPDNPDEYQREESDADQQYIDTIFEAYPDLSDALSAAADHLPEHVIENYHKALDVGDWDLVMPFIEKVIEDYYNGEFTTDATEGDEPEGVEDEEQEEVEDEWSNEEVEALNEEVAPLLMSEPDESLVDQWQDAIESTDDDTFKGIAAATASFHAGEISAEEAIEFVLENYNKRDIIRIYSHIMSQ